MKHIFSLVILLAILSNSFAQEEQCGTMKLFHEEIASNPHIELQYQKAAKLAKLAEQQIMQGNLRGFENDTIIIPVVVHIIYKTAAQNIADARVYEQIDILNKDYARLNADTNNTYIGLRPFAGGIKLKFCLATFDPEGNPTTGIIRKQTTVTSFTGDNKMKFSSQGGDNAWPADRYLNIWTVNFGSTGLLGYAQFPGGEASTDGVVISYSSFGYGTAAPYNKGRTSTHEVGHWLGLRHIWGDDTNPVETCGAGFSACGGTDGVDDTPNQCSASRGVQSGLKTDKCTPNAPGIMYMNYMDYSSDDGMNMFSQGQINRMLGTLYSTRASLRYSNACNGSSEQAEQDAKVWRLVKPSGLFYCERTPNPVVVLSNSGNTDITTLELTYGREGEDPQVYVYEEGIAINGIAQIELPNLVSDTGYSDIYCYISAINGEPDTIDNGLKVVKSLNVKSNDFPGTPSFFDGFEGEAFPSNIYELNSSNEQFVWKRTNYAAKTGTYSLFFDFYDYPTEGAIDEFTLPPLDLSGKIDPKLTFDRAYAQYEDPQNGVLTDTLEIWVKDGCGGNPVRVLKKWGFFLKTAPNTDQFFVPTANQWKADSIDLSAFIGDKVYITFRGINLFANNLYLDNLNLKYAVPTGIQSALLSDELFSVYPNPAYDKCYVKYFSDVAETVLIQLTDITGKQLMLKNQPVNKGVNIIEIKDLQEVTGNIFVTITNSTGKYSKNIIMLD